MAFEPPPNPSPGLTFQYGNIIWQYDGTAGVWNIQDASIVGGVGPEGPKGDIGPTGNTGNPATGDSAAVIVSNGFITARLSTNSLTGVASFSPSYFTVNNGAVGLSGAFSLVGVTGIGFGNDVGLTGKINLTASGSVTLTQNQNTITIGGGGGGSGITASRHQVLYSSVNGGTGSNLFLFDGTYATFGGENYAQLTFTGETFIKGGVFTNPGEYAPWDSNSVLASSSLSVRGDRGSVQRFTVTPGTSPRFTVSANEFGWNTETGAVETVIVAIQSLNGRTGSFGTGVLTEFPPPILLGTTGGIDVLSIMRIQKGSSPLVMGFVIARGLTAPNIDIIN